MAKTSSSVLGSFTRDKNKVPFQGANQLVTADATGTPVTSPLSLTTTGVFTIVVPDTAIRMTYMSAGDVRISELVAMGQYDLAKANIKESIDVSKMQNVYFKNDSSGTNNLYFKFFTV